MFQKYSTAQNWRYGACCAERPKEKASVPYCPPERVQLYDANGNYVEPRNAIPESLRLRAQVDACPMYVRPGLSSATCVPGGEEGDSGSSTGAISSITSTPGTTAPVEVRTRTAGEFTELLGIQVLNAANNRFNPDTRFQQYFPETVPAPERVVCPERIPNPVPARETVCIPQTLFAPSVPVPTN